MTRDVLGFIDVMDGHKSLLTAEWLWLYRLKNHWVSGYDFSVFIPLNNGVVVRDWTKNAYDPTNKDMQDNAIAICSINRILAKQIYKHGLFNFNHYDNITFELNKHIYGGFWGAIKEHIARTRQPMHMAMFALMGYNFTLDLIGLIQLYVALFIEPFRKGTSSKKLFFLFFCSYKGLSSKLGKSWFNLIMGNNWVETVYNKYYNKTCPALAELVKGVKI